MLKKLLNKLGIVKDNEEADWLHHKAVAIFTTEEVRKVLSDPKQAHRAFSSEDGKTWTERDRHEL